MQQLAAQHAGHHAARAPACGEAESAAGGQRDAVVAQQHDRHAAPLAAAALQHPTAADLQQHTGGDGRPSASDA